MPQEHKFEYAVRGTQNSALRVAHDISMKHGMDSDSMSVDSPWTSLSRVRTRTSVCKEESRKRMAGIGCTQIISAESMHAQRGTT